MYHKLLFVKLDLALVFVVIDSLGLLGRKPMYIQLISVEFD